MKAIRLQFSKTYLHAAFAQEGNRISMKRKQYSIVFLVLFSLLYVILRYKLDKCKIFTKQLRRSVFKCREGYRIIKLKDLSSRSVCARRKPNFYKKKTIFYSIFSALFIAVDYIAAQAR